MKHQSCFGSSNSLLDCSLRGKAFSLGEGNKKGSLEPKFYVLKQKLHLLFGSSWGGKLELSKMDMLFYILNSWSLCIWYSTLLTGSAVRVDLKFSALWGVAPLY